MRGDGWVQCQVCGELHKVKTKDTSEDDLYIKLCCPRCRDETKHLWCGEQEDIYMYYNANADPRYY